MLRRVPFQWHDLMLQFWYFPFLDNLYEYWLFITDEILRSWGAQTVRAALILNQSDQATGVNQQIISPDSKAYAMISRNMSFRPLKTEPLSNLSSLQSEYAMIWWSLWEPSSGFSTLQWSAHNSVPISNSLCWNRLPSCHTLEIGIGIFWTLLSKTIISVESNEAPHICYTPWRISNDMRMLSWQTFRPASVELETSR
jgi:hypothetical protein